MLPEDLNAPRRPDVNTLKARVLGAGGWVMAGYGGSLAIRFGSNLVMTRLLAPEMFGLMTLVTVIMTALVLFSDIGLAPNIVQSRRGDDPVFLDTAWSIQILRGLVVWGVALSLAAALYALAGTHWLSGASAYADPRLPLIVAVCSVTQLTAGLLPMKLLLARRRLAFARVTQIELATQVFGFVVMYVWARFDPSVWALAAGGIAASLLKLPLCWLFLPGPANRWRWDSAAVHEIVGFGKWVIVSSVIGVLAMNGDRLLLGGLTGPAELGVYAIAYLLASVPQLALSQLVLRVVFPALSEVARTRPGQLASSYYRFRVPFDLASLGLAGLLFVLGDEIVRLLYDARYHTAGPMLEVLTLAAFAARYQVAEQCYLALGRSDVLARIHGIRLVSLYVLVPAGFWVYGLPGAVWAIALSPLVSVFPMLYFKNKFRLLDWRKELLLLAGFPAGIGVGIVVKTLFALL